MIYNFDIEEEDTSSHPLKSNFVKWLHKPCNPVFEREPITYISCSKKENYTIVVDSLLNTTASSL